MVSKATNARLCRVAATIAACVAVGCVSRLMLEDIAFVSHRGVKPVLDKRKHATRGLECVDCHAGARTGARAGMPDRDFCMVCHEAIPEYERELELGGELFDESGRAKWGVVTSIPDSLAFSHEKHCGSLQCRECHGDVAAGRYDLMDLASSFENCRRCHQQDAVGGDCRACHTSIETEKRPHSHDAQWPRGHGWQVRSSGGMERIDSGCTLCHSESYCIECHSEEPPTDHSVFWTRAGHSLAASIDRERCAACHTEDRCVRCHMSAPARPGWHPTSGACDSCHTGLGSHVLATDNCGFCHR